MALYFRVKDNGASVFRVTEQTRQRRTELQPVAEANVRNGEVKPRKDAVLSDDERREIKRWLDDRRATLEAREAEVAQLAVEQMNAAANWYAGKPDAEAAEALADDLLMAMHDLRAAILRFRAKAGGAKAEE